MNIFLSFRNTFLVFSFSAFMGVSVFAQALDPATFSNYMPGSTPKSEEEVLKVFQTMFIKNVFLKPAYSSEYKYFSEEKSSAPEMQIYREIMMHQVATQLADTDLLKIQKVVDSRMKVDASRKDQNVQKRTYRRY